jgi:hypothetical protein
VVNEPVVNEPVVNEPVVEPLVSGLNELTIDISNNDQELSETKDEVFVNTIDMETEKEESSSNPIFDIIIEKSALENDDIKHVDKGVVEDIVEDVVEDVVEDADEDTDEITMQRIDDITDLEDVDKDPEPENTDMMSPLISEVSQYTEYQNMTIKELKDMLVEMDLPTSGNKTKLIQRIISNKNKISN